MRTELCARPPCFARRRAFRLILTAFALIVGASPPTLARQTRSASGRPGTECVSFETPTRLAAGESFHKGIGNGLEARITWDGGSAWDVTVGPVRSRDDYLWLVSPPLRTAPHRVIGEAYGVSARQSAQFSPRRFRFVTTAAGYKRARELVDAAERDAAGRITAADLQRHGRGTLDLWITDFGSNPDGALTWIRLRGRACQPR